MNEFFLACIYRRWYFLQFLITKIERQRSMFDVCEDRKRFYFFYPPTLKSLSYESIVYVICLSVASVGSLKEHKVS